MSHDLYDGEVIGSDIFVVGEMGLVFRSTDDGESFLQLTPPTSTTLFGVLGAPDGSVLVFGVAGACFRSVDRGATWNAINLGTENGLTSGRVLESGQILIASEAGEIFVSSNCGADFKLTFFLQGLSIFDVAQASDKNIILVGGSGIARLPESVLSTSMGDE